MSRPQPPQPAKLIAGLLYRDFRIQQQALAVLKSHFGPLDFLTEPRAFSYTSYYDREMGIGLFRQTCSFLNLIDPEALPEIKLTTNRIEIDFAEADRRRVNIDPGLLSEERLVLATGKNYTHRVYLRSGIYADLTLVYQRNAYQVMPWTYPDYREPELLHYFWVLRQKLIFQRNHRLPRKYRHTGDNL